jgi:hypothetical protein
MGKFISKLVFMPPKRETIAHENDILIDSGRNTKMNLRILQVKNAQLYLLISHGNAENMDHSYEWAEKVLYKNVKTNMVTYGKYNHNR